MFTKRAVTCIAILVLSVGFCPSCNYVSAITVECRTEQLIDAIIEANRHPNKTIIHVPMDCTFTLMPGLKTLQLPAISTQVVIEGIADHQAIIERSSASGTPPFRIFYVADTGSLTLRYVNLHNGRDSHGGGAIAVDGGVLNLEYTHLTGNSALNSEGGAIANNGGRVSISHSELSGNSANSGGAISNQGSHASLTISQSTSLTDNTALDGGAVYNMAEFQMDGGYIAENSATRGGGGIRNHGSLELTGVSMQRNYHTGTNISEGGGAIENNGGDVILKNCTIWFNYAINGGGIFSRSGTLNVTGSDFSGNVATSSGGAINYVSYPFTTGSFAIHNSSFSANRANMGGGIYNRGNMQIDQVYIYMNHASRQGGGIENAVIYPQPDSPLPKSEPEAGDLSITRTAFWGNEVEYGGGGALNNGGTLRMLNSTLSNNYANYGGGILNDGQAELSFVTIAEQHGIQGSGIYTSDGALTIKNSILSDNEGANCVTNMGSLNVSGENLSSDDTCSGFSIVDDPLLGAWGSTPGSQMTYPLLSGSPAIDASTDCTDVGMTPVTIDQRSVSRPYGSACDLGAFEYDSTSASLLPLAPHLPNLRIEIDANCRAGTSPAFPALAYLTQGLELPVRGINPSGTWYLVRPPDLDEACWVWGQAVTPLGDLSAVEVVQDPSLPAPAEGGGEQPGVTTQQGCWVGSPSSPIHTCVVPCPPDAWPGGACTP